VCSGQDDRVGGENSSGCRTGLSPFVETKEHLGGFAVVEVADEEAARHWAARIAVACGRPREVHRFQVPQATT
jgi:hypothetical protein